MEKQRRPPGLTGNIFQLVLLMLQEELARGGLQISQTDVIKDCEPLKSPPKVAGNALPQAWWQERDSQCSRPSHERRREQIMAVSSHTPPYNDAGFLVLCQSGSTFAAICRESEVQVEDGERYLRRGKGFEDDFEIPNDTSGEDNVTHTYFMQI